jgi:hypothetical protein
MRLTEHTATTSMISVIHTLKPRAGLTDDDTYRDFLERETGKRSAKELSVAQATRVIEKLRGLADGGGTARGAVAGLDGPVGTKLRALWISGHNLGIVRDRTDKAMLSFLQKQTGVSHVRFLASPRDGSAAIEGLKSWLGRAGKVEWPSDSEDVIGAKRAVLDAQWQRLIDLGAIEHRGGTATTPMDALRDYACRVARQNSWEGFQPHHYDEVQKALGNKLRGVLARKVVAGALGTGDEA